MVLVGGLSSVSHAGLITVQDDLVGPQLVYPGQVLAGTFDFSGITLPSSEYLTAGSVQFDFYDNRDPLTRQIVGSSRSGYVTTIENPRDHVGISIAGLSALAFSPSIGTSSFYTTRLVTQTFYRTETYFVFVPQQYLCGVFNNQICTRTVRETRTRTVPVNRTVPVTDITITRGFSGDFSQSLTLPPTLVQQLLSVGSLDFELTGLVGGSAFLRSASVQLTSASSSVPEPKSLGLVLMGAAGMFVGKRRRWGRRS